MRQSQQLFELHADGTTVDHSSALADMGGFNGQASGGPGFFWLQKTGPGGTPVQLFHLVDGAFVEAAGLPDSASGSFRVFADDDVLVRKAAYAGEVGYLHWNGSTWSEVQPAAGSNSGVRLEDLTRTGPHEAWSLKAPAVFGAEDRRANEGSFIHWDGTSLTAGAIPFPALSEGERTVVAQPLDAPVLLPGGKRGVLAVKQKRADDESGAVVDITMTVWDGSALTDESQVFRIGTCDTVAADCTGAGWAHRLPDGTIVIERAAQGSMSTSFGGPAALLIGMLDET